MVVGGNAEGVHSSDFVGPEGGEVTGEVNDGTDQRKEVLAGALWRATAVQTALVPRAQSSCTGQCLEAP